MLAAKHITAGIYTRKEKPSGKNGRNATLF